LEVLIISKRNSKKIPKLAFIYHNDDFIKEIIADLRHHYKIRIFHYSGKTRPWNLPFIKQTIRNLFKWADVCYFEWAAHLLEIASKMTKPKNTRIMTRLHKFEFFYYKDKIRWDFVDDIIFVNHAIKSIFNICPNHRQHVHHNIVPIEKFPYVKNKELTNIISIVGNIIPEKRIYEIILAMDRLSGVHDCQLWIVGDDSVPYAEYLKVAVKYLGLGEFVKFKGYQKNIQEIYAQSDIVVCNSISESFNYTLNEAALTGCFILTHNWHGASEFYHSQNRYTHIDEFICMVINYFNLSDEDRKKLHKEYSENAHDKINIRNKYSLYSLKRLIEGKKL